MSCEQTQRLIFAERDGALNSQQRVELERHLERCPGCARMRHELTRSIGNWRASTEKVDVPHAAIEWQALHRTIHAEKKRGWFRFPRPATLAWLGLPVTAAAALAVIFYSRRPEVSAPPGKTAAAKAPALASADFVDVPSNSASTMVYVDNSSGWLVVWADTPGKG